MADIIADFSDEDRLIITRNVNGQSIDSESLGDRLQDLGRPLVGWKAWQRDFPPPIAAT
ncbi:hypothetical protein [Paracoccus mutanolyticus]|uniref:hypothetical protein n=1 Tax=Paracoccus mutanolyticus TaxID=1499308 RepID=UPI0016761979|nr:hypothetical protein [Paracoccus mutanolyticus]